jgi:hypothetical protein
VAILKRAQSWSRLSQMALCSRKIPVAIALLVPQALHPWNIHLTCYTPCRISPNSQIPTGILVGYLAPLFLIFGAYVTRHPLYQCQYTERLPANHGTWPDYPW